MIIQGVKRRNILGFKLSHYRKAVFSQSRNAGLRLLSNGPGTGRWRGIWIRHFSTAQDTSSGCATFSPSDAEKENLGSTPHPSTRRLTRTPPGMTAFRSAQPEF